MVEAIKQLPSGTLIGRTTHDPYPGLPDGIPLEVKVHINADAGSIEIDLRDNIDNYAGGLNESRACATNNVVIGVFNSIDPDIPHNAGSFRCINVLLRDGCIAGVPQFPHSCSMATTNVADRLVCATQAAFADLGEGFGLAEGCFGLPPAFAVASGRDARFGGAPYVNQLFLGAAGGPGGPEADGWPTYMLPVVAGLLYHDSIEVDEQKYPIHVHEQRLIPDSGGAGRHRGGLGTSVVFGPKGHPMTVAYTVEGHLSKPRGVRGGLSGAATDAWKLDADGSRTEIPKTAAVELSPGERIVSSSGGGGGYGDPLDRDTQHVLDDVREGWVSRESAASLYGVVVRDEPGSQELEVDEEATQARREQLRSHQL
jgi:N-methylhydantoinase B